MFEVMFYNSLYLVFTILVWFSLACALFLIGSLTIVIFTVIGEYAETR